MQDGLPQRPTALLYLMPSHQFPTGHMLSAERRDAIAAWARRLRLLHSRRRFGR
jgi:DNA-binding transcriptional MocR family regulator